MVQALADTHHIVGVQTNVAFLTRLMQDPAFAAADLDTGLIERQRATLLPQPPSADLVTLALASAAMLVKQGLSHSDPQDDAQGSLTDPWDACDGWRLDGRYQQTLHWHEHDASHTVLLRRSDTTWRLDAGQGEHFFEWRLDACRHQTQAYVLRITLDHRNYGGTVVLHDGGVQTFRDGAMHALAAHDPLAHSHEMHSEQGGGLHAPMPGKIISIAVRAGDAVSKGQTLLVMEAMKMEHTIVASKEGTVEELFFALGDQVTEGAQLISVRE